MDKLSLQIDLHALRLVPAGMMALFAMQSSLALGSVEMYVQSYLLLGLGILCSFFALFLSFRSKIMTRFEFCLIGFIVIVLGASIISATDYKNWLFNNIMLMIPLFLFRYYKHSVPYLIMGASIGFALSIYLGFADLLSKPELWMSDERGVASGYLLGGNYNQMGPIFICALTVNSLATRINKWFLLNLIPVTVISVAMLFIVNSSTAIFGYLLLLAMLCIPAEKLKRTAIFALFIAVALFEVFVCFQGKGFENNELARWLIIDVLGKDMTFTYRTDMWDSALRIIVKSPLYGYGFPDADWYYANMSSLAVGPHNFILATMVYGGVIGFALYIILAYMSIKKSLNARFYVPLTAFSVLSLMMLFEAYAIQLVFLILILIYYSQELKLSNTSVANDK